MTPLMMGGGYISGSYFFVRLVLGGRWSWYTLGFLPIAAFTWFMAAATILHWEKFNHDHVSFYAWLDPLPGDADPCAGPLVPEPGDRPRDAGAR